MDPSSRFRNRHLQFTKFSNSLCKKWRVHWFWHSSISNRTGMQMQRCGWYYKVFFQKFFVHIMRVSFFSRTEAKMNIFLWTDVAKKNTDRIFKCRKVARSSFLTSVILFSWRSLKFSVLQSTKSHFSLHVTVMTHNTWR